MDIISDGSEKGDMLNNDDNHVRCYHPPVNETHLASYIWIPLDQVYKYTKELYEKGKEK